MFNTDDEDRVFFGSGRQKDDNFFLVPGRDWEVETPPQPTTFFGVIRGISRLGLLFSTGLSATLAARLLPGLLPGYFLLLGVSATGCILYASLSRRTSDRILALMLGAIVLFGVVGGSWDAIYSTLSDPSGQKTEIQVGIVGAVLLATVGFSLLLQGGRDE